MSSFVKKPELKFPDRSIEYAQAHAKDLERAEASRIAKEAEDVQVAIKQEKAFVQAPMGAKGFIYMKESGNDPTRRNAAGCLGLGQACPGSKLLAVCPNLDYECEDRFFTDYANSRYGGWGGAYEFWTSHHWW